MQKPVTPAPVQTAPSPVKPATPLVDVDGFTSKPKRERTPKVPKVTPAPVQTAPAPKVTPAPVQTAPAPVQTAPAPVKPASAEGAAQRPPRQKKGRGAASTD